MANGQPTKTVNESGSKADTLVVSTKRRLVAVTEPPVLLNSSKTMTATTLTGAKKTLMSAELQNLQNKLDIVAGALADFQSASGRIICKEESAILPSGREIKAVKIYLVADVGIVKSKSADGLRFDLVVE